MLKRIASISWLAMLVLASCVEGAEEGSSEADSTEVGSTEVGSTEAGLHSHAFSRIREIEDHRLIHDPLLGRALASRSPAIASAALIAVGRIGDVTYADRVAAALESRHREVRQAAAFAAGLLGGESLRDAIEGRLSRERDVTAVVRLCTALGLAGDVDSLAALAPLLERGQRHAIQAAAAQALGALGRVHRDLVFGAETVARLVVLADSRHEEVSVAAAFALTNLPGSGAQFPEAGVLEALRGARHAGTREYLLRVVGRIGSPASVRALAAEAARARLPTVRARAVISLGTVDLAAAPELSAPVIDALAEATRDRSSQVVVAAARALGAKGAAAQAAFPRLLARFQTTSSSWNQSEILPALVAIDAGAARPAVDAAISASALSLREAAVAALGSYLTDEDVATLSQLAADDNLRVAAAAINVLAGLSADEVPAAAKEAARARITTRGVSLFLAVVTAAANLGWTDFLAPVSATYATWTGPTGMDGRLGVLTLVQALGTQADLPLVEQALNDSEKNVVAFAAEVHLTLTGIDVSDRIPLASRVTTETPDDFEIARALRQTVRLRTTRGVIEIRMRREAPLTATNFVHLVDDGFYDGIEFHRVEPAFVVQGGDPTGTGFEGSDALIREEISSLEHHRGTVGIATAGKDTGSSQFFVNHGSNLHLNGRFTIFAEVVEGMDVVDQIQVGDRILSASAH